MLAIDLKVDQRNETWEKPGGTRCSKGMAHHSKLVAHLDPTKERTMLVTAVLSPLLTAPCKLNSFPDFAPKSIEARTKK